MNQLFEVADGKVAIKGDCIVDATRFAGVGLGLPEDFGKESQAKADLLERRLSRMESTLGLSPICAD